MVAVPTVYPLKNDLNFFIFQVDEERMEFETPGDADTLELVSPLFIGGLDANVEAIFLPPVLWSAGFKRGFVGCLRDLVINGQY